MPQWVGAVQQDMGFRVDRLQLLQGSLSTTDTLFEDTNETIRHNYRYGAFAVNPLAFTTRHKVAAECSTLCRINVALMRVFRK